MKFILFLVALTSCFNLSNAAFISTQEKMKEKMTALQKKREVVEKQYHQAKKEMDHLSGEINEMQLALIRKNIDKYDQKRELSPSLFLEERETLYQIIQTGPSSAALAAQVELDRILRIITEVSDHI